MDHVVGSRAFVKSIYFEMSPLVSIVQISSRVPPVSRDRLNQNRFVSKELAKPEPLPTAIYLCFP